MIKVSKVCEVYEIVCFAQGIWLLLFNTNGMLRNKIKEMNKVEMEKKNDLRLFSLF